MAKSDAAHRAANKFVFQQDWRLSTRFANWNQQNATRMFTRNMWDATVSVLHIRVYTLRRSTMWHYYDVWFFVFQFKSLLERVNEYATLSACYQWIESQKMADIHVQRCAYLVSIKTHRVKPHLVEHIQNHETSSVLHVWFYSSWISRFL